MLRVLLNLGAAMVAVCWSGIPAQAASITAASTAQKHVAAAIASARDGDTVKIPAGDSTWTSALTITKAINVIGAGIKSTFLRRNGPILQFSPSVNKPMRISGIYFDLGPFGAGGNRHGILFDGVCTSLRVDHCTFLHGSRSIYYRGKVYGVTDHCTFIGSYIAVTISQQLEGPPTAGAGDWAAAVHPGSQDTMVFEDCTFSCDQPGDSTGFIENELYGFAGGRACFRYCTWDYTGTGLPLINDAHGDTHSQPNGWGHSVHLYEIYNCTFKCQYAYEFLTMRGGIIIAHDNIFTKSQPGDAVTIGLKLETVGYPAGSGAPKRERVHRSFIWNNSFNGVVQGATVVGSTSQEPILNADYFNRAIQPGDPWYPYTPLVYPHPRVTAEDGGKPSPMANL
jgi:hypothetical protein